jgi:hypothetical protein
MAMDERNDDLLGVERRLIGAGSSLVLVIDGQERRIDQPQDLATALAPRAELAPSTRVRLARLDARQLGLELEATRRVQARLSDLVHWAYQTGEPAFDAWRELEHAPFADEHGWLALLRTLAEQRELDDRYRRVALVQLSRYLAARRDTLERMRVAQASARAPGPWAQETRALDAADLPSFTEVRNSLDYERLPAHQPVEIVAEPGMSIPVFLAHQRLQLVATAQGWELRDGERLHLALHTGRMVVGRAPDCDVVLHRAPKDVSRHHLIIECTDDAHLRLTDESSYGTYLPRQALPESRVS